MKRALWRANSPMLVEEESHEIEQIYSLTDKPYYVDKAKYKQNNSHSSNPLLLLFYTA
jgi:hypothetical protein